jgi:hypothetical protein
VVASAREQTDEAGNCLKEAVKLMQKAPKDKRLSPWQIMPWARLAMQLNQPADAQVLANLLKEPALAARVQLEKYLRERNPDDEPAADSWKQAVPNVATLSHARALEGYARAKSRRGGGADMLQALESVEPEKIRPLGYMGVALGAQERGR